MCKDIRTIQRYVQEWDINNVRTVSLRPPAFVFGACSALACRRTCMDEQQIRAHAHIIVLTENAVGFENGGQCVSSNRETYPLYVSKAAAKKQLRSSLPNVLFPCAPPSLCICSIPQLLCVRSKHGAFPGFVTTITLHSKQRLHANDISAIAGNTYVVNHFTGKPTNIGIVYRCFTELMNDFALSSEYYTVNLVC